MSNNKQSSLELFALALYEKGFLQGNGDEINDLLDKAKAMHKEEIIDFAHQCSVSYKHEITQKYNETYEGNK